MKYFGNYIADILLKNNIIMKETHSIYAFLFSYILDELFYDSIVLLSAILLNKFMIGLCFVMVTFPIRQFAGGVHASSELKCAIYSYGLYFLYLFVCPLFFTILHNTWIILYIVCIIIILTLAPVDTKNKRFQAYQKKKLRFLSGITISIHSLLLFIMWYNHIESYCIAITLCFIICTISIIVGKIKNRKEQVHEI